MILAGDEGRSSIIFGEVGIFEMGMGNFKRNESIERMYDDFDKEKSEETANYFLGLSDLVKILRRVFQPHPALLASLR
jgi:hypothetical protein